MASLPTPHQQGILGALHYHAKHHPDRHAFHVVSSSSRTFVPVSYSDLLLQTKNAAAYWSKMLQLPEYTTVAVQAGQLRVEDIVTVAALRMCSWRVHVFPMKVPLLTVEDVKAYLEDSEAVALLCPPSYTIVCSTRNLGFPCYTIPSFYPFEFPTRCHEDLDDPKGFTFTNPPGLTRVHNTSYSARFYATLLNAFNAFQPHPCVMYHNLSISHTLVILAAIFGGSTLLIPDEGFRGSANDLAWASENLALTRVLLPPLDAIRLLNELENDAALLPQFQKSIHLSIFAVVGNLQEPYDKAKVLGLDVTCLFGSMELGVLLAPKSNSNFGAGSYRALQPLPSLHHIYFVPYDWSGANLRHELCVGPTSACLLDPVKDSLDEKGVYRTGQLFFEHQDSDGAKVYEHHVPQLPHHPCEPPAASVELVETFLSLYTSDLVAVFLVVGKGAYESQFCVLVEPTQAASMFPAECIRLTLFDKLQAFLLHTQNPNAVGYRRLAVLTRGTLPCDGALAGSAQCAFSMHDPENGQVDKEAAINWFFMHLQQTQNDRRMPACTGPEA